MTNYTDFFNDLNSSTNKEELVTLFDKYSLSRRDRKKYPDLGFSIKVEEIDMLRKNGIITNENNFDASIAKREDLTILEKLLYALSWKNGDLVKIKHIISGICGEKTDSRVFNQFGRYLYSKDELIIDQHVLRAFIFYKDGIIFKDIKDEHYDMHFNDYKTWVESNELFNENKILIDEILFAIGKKMKPRGKQK